MRNDLKQVTKLLLEKQDIQVIYDIGANNGDWTKENIQNFPGSQFFMFEGNPLQKTPELPYRFFNILLSDKDGREVLFHSLEANRHTGDSYYKEKTIFYSTGHETFKLESRSLDSFIAERKIALPDLIKIDTQGSEVDIFKGAQKALNNCKLVLTEVPIIEYNQGAPKLHQYIDTLSYHSLVPIGVQEIHILDNTLIQIDIVFIKKQLKDNIFGGGHIIVSNEAGNSNETKLG